MRLRILAFLIGGGFWAARNPWKAGAIGGVFVYLAIERPDLMKKLLSVAMLLLFGAGCATLRSGAIIPLDFSAQPPRVAIRGVCQGQPFTTQGTVVCEQKAPSLAKFSVKVPPLQGRVVYSNGQLKRTDDFNWYPKEGFFLWKKKPILDTWLDLDLGEIAAVFGEWPVVLDVTAQSKVGVINTRGIIYHRICNDADIPCSTLVLDYECAGVSKKTGPGQIGKCERLSGSPQAFAVNLAHAKPGAILYVVSRRLGVKWALDLTKAELAAGVKKLELPAVQNGPTLVDFLLSWPEGSGVSSERTTVLLVGSDPAWTGLDRPHYLPKDDHLDWTRPVFADIMETDLYQGGGVVKKNFSTDQVITVDKPNRDDQVSCAFAWQRDSGDLSLQCLNSKLEEVRLP